MDVNLAWAIATFFLGAIVTRWNALRQHTAEVHAARVEAFETMQRETWVLLQDALQTLSEALEKLIDAYWRSWMEQQDAPDDERWAEVPSEIQAKYDHAHLRSTALKSRLADDVSRRVVQHALETVQGARWSHMAARPQPLASLESTIEHKEAEDALREAIERLGDLISRPPEPPSSGRRLWRTSRDTAS